MSDFRQHLQMINVDRRRGRKLFLGEPIFRHCDGFWDVFWVSHDGDRGGHHSMDYVLLPTKCPQLGRPAVVRLRGRPTGTEVGGGGRGAPRFPVECFSINLACGALLLRGSHFNVCVECHIPNPNECVLDRAALRVPHFCRAIRGNCCLSPRESRDR